MPKNCKPKAVTFKYVTAFWYAKFCKINRKLYKDEKQDEL